MLWLELSIFLGCILLGVRTGGIGMGTIAGIGLAIFVFIFAMPPGGPPVVVLGMILAVITALSALEAAGGLTLLVNVAERMLRKKPQYISFVAPVITYLLVVAAGTQHVIYSLLPVISEVARKSGVRPERPMSMSVIAAQQGLICSPISANTVAMLGILSTQGLGLLDLLTVIIPAALVALVLGILSVAWRGRTLLEDPVYQQRLAAGEVIDLSADSPDSTTITGHPKRALGLFLLAVLLVVLIGMFPDLRPTYTLVTDGVAKVDAVSMGSAIMIIMLATAGLILLLCNADVKRAINGQIIKNGIVALIAILGVSWLGSSFFADNRETIVGGIAALIGQYQWLFAVGLFALSILLMSQAATVVTLMPVGIALGIPAPLLIACYPAVNGYFFLPIYGTTLAAIAFDQTGTTRIGKGLLNHSFMRPGLVATIAAIMTAWLITMLLYPDIG